ncbi:DUF4917 family protein [Endozoicomonas sp. SM1973]|uniref:DUF4917 family protein n=1 Tax=Spartinivicinus marinus TaxID=2994442 RepID=A0A853I8Q5_9GAMM|nr:DUF4917 family protein [Spartinivicinus marinus]MCX4024731.1 DUF4917 family protein [Spartinivicinus marinus]NYZ69693.1 DUF4917 family protein [Spartinivicinus marinus]
MGSVVIIGNGLGMAIAPSKYTLKSALDSVNNIHPKIDLIRKFISNTLPDNEEVLGQLQLPLFSYRACRLLNIPQEKSELKELDTILNDYVYEVSCYFHNLVPYTVIEDFINHLYSYIMRTTSHIATLNYDNLLYKGILKHKYRTDQSIADGFLFGPINSRNSYMVYKSKEFNWKIETQPKYLHLHGSPYFVNNSHGIVKLRDTVTKLYNNTTGDIDEVDGKTKGKHIVLTSVEHKKFIIENSPLLKKYWSVLKHLIGKNKTIIIFGYSGYDTHLNELISLYPKKKKAIIEWEEAGKDDGGYTKEDRLEFWSKRLKTHESNIILEQMANITEFTAWDSLFEKKKQAATA